MTLPLKTAEKAVTFRLIKSDNYQKRFDFYHTRRLLETCLLRFHRNERRAKQERIGYESGAKVERSKTARETIFSKRKPRHAVSYLEIITFAAQDGKSRDLAYS